VSQPLDVINSTGLQTLAALLVGGFVFIQYRIRKIDEVKNAAELIVIEVQSAERKIKNVKKTVVNGQLDSDVSIVTVNNWARHKHFFAKHLDRDEWDDLEDFYDRAILLDDLIKYNSQMFRNDVEQIRINRQRAAADFAIDTVNNIQGDMNKEDVAQRFDLKVRVYDTLYMDKQGEMSYTPTRILEDAKKYLDGLSDILNSSAISSLKTIAKKGRP
jgi:hypothetical protein